MAEVTVDFVQEKSQKNNSVRGINVWPDNPIGHGAEGMKYRFQWNFPSFFKTQSQNLYVCSNHLHVTEDEGTYRNLSVRI
ncbi:MAG: hypothetical protein IPG79_08320 [Saprospiraceae bacterium]|nr:hypothetical protein [Saprospiraceae bacterium]